MNTQALRNGSSADGERPHDHERLPTVPRRQYGGGLYAGGSTTLDNVSVTNGKIHGAQQAQRRRRLRRQDLTINDGAFTGNTAETDEYREGSRTARIAAKGTMTVTGATVTIPT
ncbi:MAG: hypothetical protein U0W40_13945 [Acidimicrobiia bacterium]